MPDLVFGRNEPALIYYHQNIAKAIGSDRLIPITDLTDDDRAQGVSEREGGEG